MNYLTIFDHNYLAKGLALCRSLNRKTPESTIFILATSSTAFDVLTLMKDGLGNCTIVSISEVEAYYPKLLRIKSERNLGEYSWTCKGPFIQYCFDIFNLSVCSYIDADLFCYCDPTPVFEELKSNDVLLTLHDFSDQYNLGETNGWHCAQFLTFKNSENGRAILKWWTELCIQWCYGYVEPGKFGDQKYLDFFQTNWNGIADIRTGLFVAPWNIGKYVKNKMPKTFVFYHFHFLKNTWLGPIGEFYFGPYDYTRTQIKQIYKPYLEELKIIDREVRNLFPDIDSLGSRSEKISILQLFMHIAKNIFNIKKKIWIKR